METIDVFGQEGLREENAKGDAFVTRYRCGNPARVKKLVKRFVKRTSMHGASYLFKRQSNFCATCFWKTLVSVCLVCVVLSIASVIESTVSDDQLFIKSTNKFYGQGYTNYYLFPLYPQVIICRMPAWEKEQDHAAHDVMTYGFITLGFPFRTMSLQDFSKLLEGLLPVQESEQRTDVTEFMKRWNSARETYQKNYGNMSEEEFVLNNSVSCEDMFESCIYGYQIIPCCDLFEPVLTSSGLCFRVFFSSGSSFVEPGGFPFTINMVSPQHTDEANMQGFFVTASHPRLLYHWPHLGSAVLLAPGWSASVQIRLTVTNRVALYSPWQGKIRRCPSLPSSIEPNEEVRLLYTQRDCFIRQLSYMVVEQCNCTPMVYRLNGTNGTAMRTCSSEDIVSCYIPITARQFTPIYDCPLPCFDYTFKMDSAATLLGGGNTTRLVLRFDRETFTLEEYWRVKPSDILSTVGGYLGFYIGGSIMTVIEIVTFVVLCAWYGLKPTKVLRKLPLKAFRRKPRTRETQFAS